MSIDETNTDGYFDVRGSEEEMTFIDPEIRIDHDCNLDANMIEVHNATLTRLLSYMMYI